MSHDPSFLPADLPAPVDDGAAAHLIDIALPSVTLDCTNGSTVDLTVLSQARPVIVFAYPRTGRPGVNPPPGWDDIPGARGCTPEACGFRDHYVDFASLGVDVLGLSTQDVTYQAEAKQRLHLPFHLVSDKHLQLTQALRLPTFVVEGAVLLRRLTMVAHAGRVANVIYPVFPPDAAAEDVLEVLRRQLGPPPTGQPA